jgi:hypothetical protein
MSRIAGISSVCHCPRKSAVKPARGRVHSKAQSRKNHKASEYIKKREEMARQRLIEQGILLDSSPLSSGSFGVILAPAK